MGCILSVSHGVGRGGRGTELSLTWADHTVHSLLSQELFTSRNPIWGKTRFTLVNCLQHIPTSLHFSYTRESSLHLYRGVRHDPLLSYLLQPGLSDSTLRKLAMCKHLYKYLLREKRQNPLYTAARGQKAHAGLCTPEFEHLCSGSQQQVEEEMQKKYLGASGFLVCVCTCVCVCAGGGRQPLAKHTQRARFQGCRPHQVQF